VTGDRVAGGGRRRHRAAPTHALVALTDRSAERRAENERELLFGELQSTLEATADGLLVTDLGGRLRTFNRRFAEMWAMPLSLLQERDDDGVRAWMLRSVVDARGWDRRLQALREATRVASSDRIELHSGRVLECIVAAAAPRRQPRGRVFSFRDLSERIAAQERIEALTHGDALTGLANRARLAEHVPRLPPRCAAGAAASPC